MVQAHAIARRSRKLLSCRVFTNHSQIYFEKTETTTRSDLVIVGIRRRINFDIFLGRKIIVRIHIRFLIACLKVKFGIWTMLWHRCILNENCFHSLVVYVFTSMFGWRIASGCLWSRKTNCLALNFVAEMIKRNTQHKM